MLILFAKGLIAMLVTGQYNFKDLAELGDHPRHNILQDIMEIHCDQYIQENLPQHSSENKEI